MKIIQKTTKNKTTGRNGQTPTLIVVHRTCGSFAGAVSWLQNTKSQASSHFVVSKLGEVVQLVPIEDTAWCNGTSTDSTSTKYYKNSKLKAVNGRKDNANSYTISIEFEGLTDENGELTVAQLNAGVELIKHIVSEVKRIYGYEIKVNAETLVGHCHITPNWKPNCPGNLFPYKQIIERVGTYMKKDRKFNLKGEVKEVECIVEKGVTYAPVRIVAEMLGHTVNYDSETEVTTIK